MQLKDQAKKFPLSSGVYKFVAKNGEILYIGRATNLRGRVSHYFGKDIDRRIGEMVSVAKNVKCQKTDSVLEAIILEANLIKKYWPKYNIKDRDDKSFTYLVIPKDDFPKPLFIRGRELEKFSSPPLNLPLIKGEKNFPPLYKGRVREGYSRVFGPYQSVALLKKALKIIRRIFPYSTCAPNSGHPCFDYQIGLCPGTCLGLISQKDYQKNIKNLILFLSGKKKQLNGKLKKENPEAIVALKQVQDVALITDDEVREDRSSGLRVEGYDISHFAGKETYGSMIVFKNGQPDKSQYRLFKIKIAPANDDLAALTEIITRRLKHVEWPTPDLMVIDGGLPQVRQIFKVFKLYKIIIPFVGISKLQNDKLIFPPNTAKTSKELIETSKRILLQVRDESHRFANMARKRKMAKLV